MFTVLAMLCVVFLLIGAFAHKEEGSIHWSISDLTKVNVVQD